MTTALAVLLTPEATTLALRPASGRRLTLNLAGYQSRLVHLLDLCRQEKIPVFLGGALPITTQLSEQLALCRDAGLRLHADREFRQAFRHQGGSGDISLEPASLPPTGAFPLSLFTLVRDPLWRVLQDAAIPLPRRIAFAVEDPLEVLRRQRDILADTFSHFLYTGGHLADRVAGRALPPPHGMAAALLRIFPEGVFIDPPTAALLGIRARLSDELTRWILVHAGGETVTVLAVEGERIRGGFRHAVAATDTRRLNEYIAQLVAGRRFEEELRLDDGLYVGSRLLPEEEGPWEPVILCGFTASRYADLPGARREGDNQTDIPEIEGLLTRLGNPNPPGG